ncbi:M15 family metallopeptidase [Pedobacter sp. L105]|uniref:M15 family metallopeptidase n=1 Tax=Pedobacter sp. L105 TaxID=1641871 RepID=UPI00131C0171|nr:M15 family metallopeptidase [Pedobacter sp. L105]
METKSIEKLNQLHPLIRQKALNAYAEAVASTPAGVHPLVTQTLRTFAESDALYAQGRTAPGAKVTNAPGGSSYHNYGLALDFVNLVNGVESWKVDSNWMKVVSVFKKHGFVWGGDFHSILDQPHFEMTFGHNWKALLANYKAGNTFVDNDIKYVTIEI